MWLILHVSTSTRSRATTYFENEFPEFTRSPLKTDKNLVLLTIPSVESGIEAIQRIVDTPVVNRHISSIYLCTHCLEISSDDDFDPPETTSVGHVFRIQAYPKTLVQTVTSSLPLSVQLNPKEFTHVYQVIRVSQDLVMYGIVAKQHNFNTHPRVKSEKEHVHVSRAYYKLREALPPNAMYNQAIDVGSSPGGWTEFLSSRCKLVISIDPGELDPRVLSLGNVINVRSSAASSVEKVTHVWSSSSILNLPNILVCDMNRDVMFCWDMLKSFVSLLNAGDCLVLTVKLMRDGLQARADTLEEIRGALVDSGFRIENIKWLFANQLQERTICAVKV